MWLYLMLACKAVKEENLGCKYLFPNVQNVNIFPWCEETSFVVKL